MMIDVMVFALIAFLALWVYTLYYKTNEVIKLVKEDIKYSEQNKVEEIGLSVAELEKADEFIKAYKEELEAWNELLDE